MTTPIFLFYAFAALSILGALGMVLNVRNTVASVMSLVVAMVVVMLLNLSTDEFLPGRQRLVKLAAAIVGVILLVELLRVLTTGLPEAQPLPEGFGGYAQVGVALYTDYVLLVEMSGLLLLAAIVGSVLITKRRLS